MELDKAIKYCEEVGECNKGIKDVIWLKDGGSIIYIAKEIKDEKEIC